MERMVSEKLASLLDYREALAGQDKEVFDRLMASAKDHVIACAKADKLTFLESLLLTIVIEQQKTIEGIGGELM
jgi:GTP-binding protein EngB required for normal cell division